MFAYRRHSATTAAVCSPDWGPDSGFDSMADAGGIAGLAHLLDTLDSTNELPRTLLFNLNPNMNAAAGHPGG